MVKGNLELVKKSSAQDVLVTEDSNGNSIHGRKPFDFQNAHVDRSSNSTAVSHLQRSLGVWAAKSQDIGHYQTTSVASINQGEGFYALSLGRSYQGGSTPSGG